MSAEHHIPGTMVKESNNPSEISVVIRVRNEVDNLARLFDRLEDQTVTPQVLL